jgi:hypothetical protein
LPPLLLLLLLASNDSPRMDVLMMMMMMMVSPNGSVALQHCCVDPIQFVILSYFLIIK